MIRGLLGKALAAEGVIAMAVVVGAAIVAATSVVTMDAMHQSGLQVAGLAEVDAHMSRSHSFLEESLSGDDVATGQAVLALQGAHTDCHRLLEVPPSHRVLLLTDETAGRVIAPICERLDQLLVLTEQRLAEPRTSGIGGPLDRTYHATAESTAALLTEDRETLRAASEVRTRLILLHALVGAALMLVGGIGIASFLRVRTRAQLTASRSEGEQAEVFNRLGDRIAFAGGEQDVVGAAVSAVRRLVGAPAGDLLVLNHSLNRLNVGGAWGPDAPVLGDVVAVTAPSRCPGIKRGAVFDLPDATDELAVHCEARPVAEGSLLCVPLVALGQIIGVLHLARHEPHAFSDADRRLATRVAEQTSIALANTRLMATMEALAMTDPLTGLHNARFFDPLLERELAVAGREGLSVGVLMLDIDHFKKFNDTYGHPGGDQALKAFARAIRSSIRDSDTAARYGGEEFVVLVHGADLEAAASVAEKIRAAVEALTIELGAGRTAHVTCSVGVTASDAHGSDRVELMRLADEALYQAKEGGRNRVVAAATSDPRLTAEAASVPARARTPLAIIPPSA